MQTVKKVGEYDEASESTYTFEYQPNYAHVSGFPAFIMLTLIKSPIRGYLGSYFSKMTDLALLRTISYEDPPTEYPIVNVEDVADVKPVDISNLMIEKDEWPYKTIYDYNLAYRTKIASPNELMAKLLTLIEREDLINLSIISEINAEEIAKASQESTARYQDGKPLSILDGVPFVVKNNIEIHGFKCYNGADFCNVTSQETATVVKRLKEQGCILLGTVNMSLLGANVVGYNTSKTFLSSRNPFNPNKYPGGSSSGSAVAVACGIVPFSIGTDSLGSIRIPSSYCGIVGLKPTLSRVSNNHVAISKEMQALCVTGPMATCVSDAAIIYSVIAGPDEDFPIGLNQPPIVSPTWSGFEISKIKFGIHNKMIQFAGTAQKEHLNKVCECLQQMGSTISDISIPELRESSSFPTLILSRDVRNFPVLCDDPDTISKTNDIAINLTHLISEYITDEDMMKIDQQRTRSIDIMKRLFDQIDVLILPTTCSTAPDILDKDSKYGFVNKNILTSALFFVSLSSFVGLPSISLNVGYESDTNMPVGIQLISKWWTEDTILSVANVIENLFPLKLKPQVLVNPIGSI